MFCSVGLSFLGLVVLTSFLWAPLLILNLPFILLGLLVLRVTGLSHRLLLVYYAIYDFMFYRSEFLRKTLWQVMYDLMVYLYPQCKWRCMNYGYASLTPDGKTLDLSLVDEYERFPLQMYMTAASCQGAFTSWADKTVVEVGSGRGGGLEYIHRTMKPSSSYGVDYSDNQVEFCKQSYGEIEGLAYAQGDSEKLDQVKMLEGVKADLIFNVESSHCYGNFDAFVAQVSKMLKQGGQFSMTDFRADTDLPAFETSLLSHGMVPVMSNPLETSEEDGHHPQCDPGLEAGRAAEDLSDR